MSYTIDANILIYASDEASPSHPKASRFLASIKDQDDILCLSWATVMAYLRISTHPSICSVPLTPETAWGNIRSLITLPRCRMVAEEESFPTDYETVTAGISVRGNLVPDAHLATILRQHGVKRIYTADTDFLKFRFLEVVNPLE